jgi:hypothetical protein
MGIAAVTGLIFVMPVVGNLWWLATGTGFFIPEESSIFSFRVTKENDGSGEWWLYGEDHERLYALHPTDPVYLSVLKQERARCANFNATDQSTWCSPEQHPTPGR